MLYSDALKMYTVAHGHKVKTDFLLAFSSVRRSNVCPYKTTNLIINLEEDEALWLSDDSRTLASYGLGQSRVDQVLATQTRAEDSHEFTIP